MKNTLIVAVSPHLSVEDICLCLIICTHDEKIYVDLAVKMAFTEWARTAEGRQFADENGTNWGDSLDIPDRFLRKQGIHKYKALLCGGRLVGAKYDHKITVDHDENLVKGYCFK